MIQSFNTKRSFYEREESTTDSGYDETRGSLWVRWIDNRFCGRSFVAGSAPTRLQVIKSIYHAGVEGVDY